MEETAGLCGPHPRIGGGVGIAGDQDDRRGVRQRRDPRRDLHAVEPRQPTVEQDDVRTVPSVGQGLEGLLARSSCSDDIAPAAGQEVDGGSAEAGVIVDQENAASFISAG